MISRILLAVALATLLVAVNSQSQTSNPPDETSEPSIVVSPSDEVTTTSVADVTTGGEQTTSQTTVGPTSAPPKQGSWNVTSTDEKTTCILLEMAATFHINYTDTSNKTRTAMINLPTNAEASGVCGNDNQKIVLTFFGDWTLTMEFQKGKDMTTVSHLALNYTTTEAQFPDISAEEKGKTVTAPTNDTGKVGQVNNGNSYECNSDQTINITSSVSMETSDLQMEAYRTSKDDSFSTAQQCPADTETSNIVPIVVGAALAALVVIVLIAYLISRNRNKTGYESV